jgi:hypothetical protein
MKRSLFVVLLAAFWALSAPADSSAQAAIAVGGGITFPTGDYGDYANTGWLAHAGVGFPVGDAGLSVGAAGYFGANNHEPPPDGDKTNLYGGVGFAQYNIGDAEAMSPFVFGMAGLMVHDYKSDSQPSLEGSDTGFAAGGGAGLTVPLGGVAGFVEAWYLVGFFDGGNTNLGGVTAGVQFALGGGGM